MSGHIFFADTYYGYDDALYGAMRLIAASARLGKSVTELRGAMPHMLNTPELRFQVDESRKFAARSEEHTSELQSLMRISYAVFCLKKKKHNMTNISSRN